MKRNEIMRVLLIALLSCGIVCALASCGVSYTVSYSLGEHAAEDATVPESVSYAEGEQITLPAAPEAEEGWEFAAWSDGSETYDAGESYTVEGNVTFTATWNEVSAPAVTYTVTYALGEHAAQGAEVPAAQTVNEGESVTLPAAPAAAAGYAFSGWYVGSDPLTGETYTPAASVTVTAQFAPITYTVEFNANGGSGDGMASMTFTYDAEQALTANTFTRTGYTFAGWTTNSEGTQAEYTDGQSVSNLTAEANATVTLYAVWTTNAYTVKFNANGGQGTMADQTFAYGTSQALTANTFTRTGYTFAGWTTNSEGTQAEYTDGQSVSNLTTQANATVTLYAVWMANQITVNFHYNYTTEAQTISVTIAYNSEMGDDEDWATSTQTIASSRNGYECTAWNTQADGKGTAYTADTVLRSTETVDLYAQWSVIGYNITYELDGGTNADGNPATYTVESEAITLAAPTRMGYNFEGWTYDGQKEPEETVTIEKGSTGDRTYTAVWTAKTFTVTLDFNDDTTENKTITVTFDSTFGAAADNGWVAAPARAGYEFAGWYDNAQFEGDVYTAETKVSAELVEGFTLYANWTAHRWDVSVDGEVTQVENNGTYQLTMPEAQADKTFMGWADEEGEIVYTEAEELTVTEDITLTTVWATHNAIANEAELLAVLADQSVSAIRLADNIEMTASGIDIRRNFSIDLNEKTITFTTSASAAAAQRIRLTAYGTSYEQRISVSITNGALDFNTNANPNIDGSASMIFTQNVDLTMSDVTVTSDAMGLFIACGKLTMTDCVVTAAGGYAIGTNASVREGSELYGPVEMTIEGSTLTANQADGAGLLFNVEGELTLTDTAITGGRQGVVIRSGTATITGGSITSAWSDPDKDSYLTTWGSGTAVPMAALVIGDISAGVYANNTIVTISGTQVNVTGDPEGARYIYIAGDTVDETMARLTYGCNDEYMAALEGKENGIILGNEGIYTSVTVLHNESGMIHEERQEPTCTEDGHEEYYQCPDCKTYFTAGTERTETIWEALVIKADGVSHVYSIPVLATEGENIGKFVSICEDCGDIQVIAQADSALTVTFADGKTGYVLDETIAADDFVVTVTYRYTQGWNGASVDEVYAQLTLTSEGYASYFTNNLSALSAAAWAEGLTATFAFKVGEVKVAEGSLTFDVVPSASQLGIGTATILDSVRGNASSQQISQDVLGNVQTTGVSVSFWLSQEATSDWDAVVINNSGLRVTLPNLDPWNNTSDQANDLKGINKTPQNTNFRNGATYYTVLLNSICYVTVTLNADGTIDYYKNGVLVLSYGGTETMGDNTALISTFTQRLLNFMTTSGFAFAGGVSAADLFVTTALDATAAASVYSWYRQSYFTDTLAMQQAVGTALGDTVDIYAVYAGMANASVLPASALADVTTNGLAVTFWLDGALSPDNDWSIVIRAGEYYVRGGIFSDGANHVYPGDAGVTLGAAAAAEPYQTFLAGNCWVTISLNTDGSLSYYKDGVLAFTYGATLGMPSGGAGTIATSVNAMLVYIAQNGMTVGGRFSITKPDNYTWIDDLVVTSALSEVQATTIYNTVSVL